MSQAHYVKMIVGVLARRKERLVLAESCTAGLVTATLAKLAGISEHLCGAFVVYRNEAKQKWLGVKRQTLARYTAVSEQVAEEMACGALRAAPTASWAVSVTGHLGPKAPPDLDGVVLVGIARRETERRVAFLGCERYRLTSQGRLQRRDETVSLVLDLLAEVLARHDPGSAS